MPSPRRHFYFFILLFILVGCQSAPEAGVTPQPKEQQTAAKDGEMTEEQSEPFRPYEYREVPALKTLIFADGFETYTSEQPYILGYSYDGDYIATVIYDAAQEGYIVEVTDTLTNSPAYEAFVPDAERLLKGDQVGVDLLNTAQESLDMGYRIKVAPVVNEQESRVFEQRDNENHVYRFQMGVEEDTLFRITVSDEDNHTWFVVNDRTPLNTEQTFMHKYTWTIHPQVPNRVTVMIYTAKEGQPVTPYVYSVDTAALDKSLSEQSLKKTLEESLEHPKIVYHYPSTANPLSVLAVEAEGEKEMNRSPLYAGVVTQFVLLDHKGAKVVYGDSSGVFNKDDHRISEAGEVDHYVITLVPGSMSSNAELLVVDAYDEGDTLLQTLEWAWIDKKSGFRLIGAEEKD